MALDEQSWHEAWDALAEAVGAEAAATLMGAWPRDVARRSDIDSLGARIDGVEVRLDARIDALDAKFDASQVFLVERIERTEANLVAIMRGELNAQVRSLLFGFVGLQATLGAFVIGLVRFAL